MIGPVSADDAALGQHRVDARHPDPVPEAFDEVLAHGRPAPVDGRAEAHRVEAVALRQR